MNRHPTYSDLDTTIARMRRILEAGRWPSGLELNAEDRRILEWNLEISRQRRAERAERDHARA